MEQDISIHALSGDDPLLYPIVGPLVMNAEVLKANNNYPFKTSHHFIWYIALSASEHPDEMGKVLGFIPLEQRRSRWLVNNYYVEHDDPDVLKALLKALPTQYELDAIVLIRHKAIFQRAGYKTTSELKQYVKMTKKKKEPKKTTKAKQHS